MADKYRRGELLADSEEFLTGKDGTFSGTVTATGFQLPGGLDTDALSNWHSSVVADRHSTNWLEAM